jgi:AcrR family transcriptional regulator
VTRPDRRVPLTRDRVIDAALALADAGGLAAISMRRVAEQLGVEAMSLYRHVAHKDDLLDALVERVLAQIDCPARPWREAMRDRAASMRAALLRHAWAATLIESRVSPGPARLRLHDTSLAALRGDGFPVGLARHAILTLDAYIYGFVLQELAWPFGPGEEAAVIDTLRPAIPTAAYPHLVEMMDHVAARVLPDGDRAAVYAPDFLFGLELILDSLDRARSA